MSLESRMRRIKYLQEAGYEVDARGNLVHREMYKAAHGWIPRDWVVHHIDCNKKNNNLANLIALPARLHNKIHDIMRKTRCHLDRAYIEKAISLYRVPAKGKRPGRRWKHRMRALPPLPTAAQEVLALKEEKKKPVITIRRSVSSFYR